MYNAVTLKEYTGNNADMLNGLAWSYQSREWATFKQWVSIGRVPKAGSKGTKLKWFKEVPVAGGKFKRQLQFFVVFNKDQTEELKRETLASVA